MNRLYLILLFLPFIFQSCTKCHREELEFTFFEGSLSRFPYTGDELLVFEVTDSSGRMDTIQLKGNGKRAYWLEDKYIGEQCKDYIRGEAFEIEYKDDTNSLKVDLRTGNGLDAPTAMYITFQILKNSNSAGGMYEMWYDKYTDTYVGCDLNELTVKGKSYTDLKVFTLFEPCSDLPNDETEAYYFSPKAGVIKIKLPYETWELISIQ